MDIKGVHFVGLGLCIIPLGLFFQYYLTFNSIIVLLIYLLGAACTFFGAFILFTAEESTTLNRFARIFSFPIIVFLLHLCSIVYPLSNKKDADKKDSKQEHVLVSEDYSVEKKLEPKDRAIIETDAPNYSERCECGCQHKVHQDSLQSCSEIKTNVHNQN